MTHIQTLMAKLAAYHLQCHVKQDQAQIRCIKLPRPTATLEDDILYIGATGDFPPLANNPGVRCTILSLGTSPVIQQYQASSTVNVFLCTDRDTDLFTLFNCLQDILLEDRHWQKQLEAICGSPGSERNLELVLQLEYQYAGCPIGLFDPALKLLACYPLQSEPSSPPLPEWNRLVSLRSFGVGFSDIKRQLQSFLSQQEPSDQDFLCSTRDGEFLFRHLYANDTKIATIAIALQPESSLPHLRYLIDELEKPLLHILHTQSNTLAVDSFENFLTDILRGERKSSEQTRQQLFSLGWRPEDYFFFVKIKRAVLSHLPPDQKEITRQLEKRLSNAFYLSHDDALFILINSTRCNKLSRNELEEICRPIVTKYDLVLGLSNRFGGFEHIYVCKDQPEISMEFGGAINPDNRIYPYSLYILYHMIHICAAHMDITTLIHPSIKALYAHDKASDSNYVHTLLVYINSDRRLQKTADDLHIHKNTLIYRLEKIKNITQIDFNDLHRTTYLKISCSIVKYLNKYQSNP